MKKLLTILCTTAILSLLVIFQASAQINDAADLNVSDPNAVFCSANHFKLNASLQDQNGNAYASYKWAEVNSLGGGVPISGETDAVLELTNVLPGFHTYRVIGIQDNSGGLLCDSEPQDFTVYVLPEITVTASTTATITKYCENAVPTGGSAIVLQSSVAFASAQSTAPDGFTNPALADFALNYKWFKVKASDPTVRTEITGATNPTYTVAETEVGTFYYESQVAYAVNGACGPYSGTVKSGGSNVEIIVTPKPGKPTIGLEILN